MPKIKYLDKKIRAKGLATIKRANDIIADYEKQGFTLTLRQLYYQFVQRGWIPNTQKSYDNLGNLINDARLVGLIDWNAIEDRTRFVRSLSRWENPSDIISGCAEQFHVDLWKGQEYRPEVWIEKDALVGVFEGVCQEFDTPLFSCRGYTSQSEMWGAAQRFIHTRRSHQVPVILHFGDHDPSGMDMSRDITDRIELFAGGLQFERMALNMDQVEQYQPPPNFAKTSDARFKAYVADYGTESWELDALNPTTLAALVRTGLTALIDQKKWRARIAVRTEGRRQLKAVSERWDDVTDALDNDKL